MQTHIWNWKVFLQADGVTTISLYPAYARTLNMEYLGMTGKFHTTWGEFGGFKHPNALLYETALSLANGAKCSIGDQFILWDSWMKPHTNL